jgi:uncharacterized membrane protein/predicted DsbA family dithiol-disulfide isomerase
MHGKANIGATPLVASLAPVLAGLVASAALAVDYLQPRPVFCSEGAACEALRQTVFAAPLSVPTPVVGLVGFLALGVASLLPGRRARVAQVALATAASLVGALLLATQWALGRFCPFCCVADASAIASAFVAWWRLLRAPDPPSPPRALVYAGAGSMVLGALLPVTIGWRLASRPPEAIRAEMARTPSGQVTIVDFVDFECPYCRMTNAALEPILDEHKDRLRVVRRQVPLRMHPHALDAARAACCGERLGSGDAMVSALFAAPVDSLTRDGCDKLAQSIGLPLDAYRGCVGDPKTDERIEADRAVFKASGGYALPTIWVDGHALIGAQSKEDLEKVIGDALARVGS